MREDKVHYTRLYKNNYGKLALSYCGLSAMRCTDQEVLVTCKSCLKLIAGMKKKADSLFEARFKHEARNGLTEAEKGIPCCSPSNRTNRSIT